MGLKLIADLSHAHLPIRVKVYRDYEWDEYRVVLHIHGARVNGATSFQSDRADALGTAHAMLSHAARNMPAPILPCERARDETDRLAPTPARAHHLSNVASFAASYKSH